MNYLPPAKKISQRSYLVFELFFPAVGVVLQLNQLLLAHAYNLTSLPSPDRLQVLPVPLGSAYDRRCVVVVHRVEV